MDAHPVAPWDISGDPGFLAEEGRMRGRTLYYVLTMGCTEGNLYGLWNGRDYLAGKVLLDDPDTVPGVAGQALFRDQDHADLGPANFL
ncbi:MAG: hypothetical protein VKN83_08005 [Cyanobacteriota bacterium]|nr:hypothetical protein [Cyanobacteriota bacterium]